MRTYTDMKSNLRSDISNEKRETDQFRSKRFVPLSHGVKKKEKKEETKQHCPITSLLD